MRDISTPEFSRDPVPGSSQSDSSPAADMIVSSAFPPTERSPLAIWQSTPERAGALLAQLIQPWNNHLIKVYRPELETHWDEVFSSMEKTSRSAQGGLVGINVRGEFAAHRAQHDCSPFYHTLCTHLIRRFSGTEVAALPQFEEFCRLHATHFARVYAPYDVRKSFEPGFVQPIIDPLENLGANLSRIYDAMGFRRGEGIAEPHLVIRLGDVPIVERGVFTPLSAEEERQTEISPEFRELAKQLSIAVSTIQELMCGTRGSGAHYTVVVGGWLLDALRTGYSENQRWLRSIFREGVIDEELMYHTVIEVG